MRICPFMMLIIWVLTLYMCNNFQNSKKNTHDNDTLDLLPPFMVYFYSFHCNSCSFSGRDSTKHTSVLTLRSAICEHHGKAQRPWKRSTGRYLWIHGYDGYSVGILYFQTKTPPWLSEQTKQEIPVMELFSVFLLLWKWGWTLNSCWVCHFEPRGCLKVYCFVSFIIWLGCSFQYHCVLFFFLSLFFMYVSVLLLGIDQDGPCQRLLGVRAQ